MSRDSRREAIVGRGRRRVRAYQTSNDNFDQAIADRLGMNRTDMRCVDLIDQAGGMTAGELARAADLTTGAVTAVIDRLERAGMARRVADPADRRRVRVEVTPKLWELTGPLLGPFIERVAGDPRRLQHRGARALRRVPAPRHRRPVQHIQRIREM